MSDTPAWHRVTTNQGHTLGELSQTHPVLLVFLRHAGCPFCKETLAKLKLHRAALTGQGTQIVLVHMQTDANAAAFFRNYGFEDVERVSDPDRTAYALFQIPRGSWWQVAGPAVWWRGLKATLTGAPPGIPEGDIKQLSGTVLVHRGQIVRTHLPQDSGDIPAFSEFATCELPTAASS